MSPSTIALIVSGVMLLFVLFGFLSGIRRGVKKQSLNFGFFVATVVLALLLTPLITKALLGIKFNIDGTNQTLQQYIVSLLTQNDVTAELYKDGSGFAGLVNNLPAMIASIVVYVVVLYVFLFLMWIIYLITAHFVFKKKKRNEAIGGKVYTIKEGQAVEFIDIKPKKYRWWGGLVGAVQGFLLCVFTLIPISGLVSTFNDVRTYNSNIVYAETTQEKTAIQKLIEENLPPLALDIINGYSSSAPYVVGSFLNLDDLCFNAIASTNVNGTKIKLRDEVLTFAQTYDSIEFLFSLDFNNINWKTFNFSKLNRAVDLLFDSEIFRELTAEIMPYALNYIETGDVLSGNEMETEIKELVKSLKAGFDNDFAAASLKAELKTMLSVFETLCETGIVDELSKEEINLNNILDTLIEDDNKNLNELLNNFFSSKAVKGLLAGSVNLSLDLLEDQFADNTNLGRIDVEEINWEDFKEEIKTLVTSGVEIYEIINNSGISLEQIEEDFTKIYNLNYQSVLNNFGKILDTMSNSSLFTSAVNGENIYNNLLTAINKTEVGEYIDVTKFQSSSSSMWQNEMKVVTDILSSLKPVIKDKAKFKDLNYFSLEKALTEIFDTKTLASINIELLDEVIEQVDEIENAQVKDLVNSILTEMRSKQSFIELKNDVLAAFDIIKIIAQTGVLDIKEGEEYDLADLMSGLDKLEDGKCKYEILIDTFISSNMFKKAFVKTFNIVLTELESGLETTLGRVEEKADNWNGWTETTANLKNAFKELTAIANEFKDKDFDLNIETLDQSFVNSLSNFGGLLDSFATLPILNYGSGANIYNEIITALNDDEIAEYINFESATLNNFNNGTFWKTELVAFKDALSRLIDKKVTISSEEKNLLQAITAGDDLTEIVKTFTDSDVDVILTPVLEGKLFKNLALLIIDEINFQIEKLTDETITKETATIPETSPSVNLVLQSEDIKTIIKEAIKVLSIEDPEISQLKPLLEAIETNAEKVYKVNPADANGEEGVFKNAYLKLEEFVNAEAKKEISNKFDIDNTVLDNIEDIPLGTIIDVADKATVLLEKIEADKETGDTTLTSDDVNEFVDVLKDEEVQEMVETIAGNGGTIEIPEDVKQDVSSYIEDLADAGTITGDLKDDLLKILGLMGA